MGPRRLSVGAARTLEDPEAAHERHPILVRDPPNQLAQCSAPAGEPVANELGAGRGEGEPNLTPVVF